MIKKEGYIKHTGVLEKSGRYAWGSGDDPYQRLRRGKGYMSFLESVNELRRQGMSDGDIARGMNFSSSTELRRVITIASHQDKQSKIHKAMELKDKKWSTSAIAREMGVNESTVRSWLNPEMQRRQNLLYSTADMLEKQMKSKKYLDVGLGVEAQLGISRTKLDASIALLRTKGYTIHEIKVENIDNPGKYTNMMVLAPPDTTLKDVSKNRADIQMVTAHTSNGGQKWDTDKGIIDPVRVSKDRVGIAYESAKDGIIELRPGVADLDLGNATYAQVRIAVEGDQYLKGVAIYNNNLPKGVDIMFNTNKKTGTPKEDVMKNMYVDKKGKSDENPFTATIKPGGQKGALNIVNEEGDWSEWSKTISSQVLSKQSPILAKKQLGLVYDNAKADFDDVMQYSNPEVKKKLLLSLADGLDSDAVDLKAASLPRSSNHLLLPVENMKPTEVYAPNYRNGEKVALIRYPHGGKFEIPQLTVNNKTPDAKKIIGNAKDAIGIHPSVANILSGADFDGDTVTVIPNNSGSIKSQSPLKQLENFDPKASYPMYEGMQPMTEMAKGKKMGDISNLITDMTIKGANDNEIAKAVKHSMVVIDAPKHKLDYKQSYIDNDIASLKKKYQGKANAGASTIISRASSQARVSYRREIGIDKETGEKKYKVTPKYYERDGKKIERMVKSTKMYETKDAHELSSGTRMESIYADHANKLKELANQARKEAVNMKGTERVPAATALYKDEVKSLEAGLNNALRQKPLERHAQLIANVNVVKKRQAKPNMDDDALKKIKRQAITQARINLGKDKTQSRIDISPKEWEAIQNGALSSTKVSQILSFADEDQVKEYALPRTKQGLSNAKISRIKSFAALGYTQAEIADFLGISTTKVNEVLK